jgi:hypothetical protein
MALSNDQLHTLVSFMTPDIKENYSHMIPLWRAVLGGYILPEMARQDPESVEGNKAFEALIAEFSPSRIEEMLEPGEITKRIPVAMDVPEFETKTVYVKEGEKVLRRRNRATINKVRRKKHDLYSYERDMVIKLLNDRQDILTKEDEIFKRLVDAVNSKRDPEEHISASQLAGYWSSLCRMARSSKERREAWAKRNIKKGVFSIVPEFTEDFINRILSNASARKKEASERAEDKAKGITVKVISTEIPETEHETAL